jgi:hypothetical protein
MSFTTSQQGLLIAVLLSAVVISVVAYLAKERALSLPRILIYGGGCALFGLVTACLTGRECLDVLLLKDTAGFGRAYVAGLIMITSAPFILLLRIFFGSTIRRNKD